VSEYLRIFALVLPLSAVGDILLGATRGFGTMLPSAAIDLIIKPAVRVSLLFAIVQVSHSPVIVAVGWAAPIVLSLALAAGSLHLLLRNSGEGGSTRPEVEDANVRALASDFWRFALPQSLSGVLQVAVVWVDVVLLGALKSTHDAGTYATLSRYLLVGTLGLSAIALAIAPLMSSLLAEGELSRAGSVYRVVTAWIVASAFPIYFVMAVFSPVLMRLFGGSFSGGAGPLTILSIAMLANIATGPVVMILLMGGRSGLLLVDSGVAFLVNVVLNVMLIPPYGMTGAAIAWSSGILAMNALALLQVRRAWQIHPYGRGLLVIATGASLLYGVLGLVISRVIGMDIAGLIATCLIGSAVYGTALWSARGELQFAVLWGAIRTRRVTAGFESR
jgi:O-antigen/teichoic acid export membrane protein